jgi:hypothetical protein
MNGTLKKLAGTGFLLGSLLVVAAAPGEASQNASAVIP